MTTASPRNGQGTGSDFLQLHTASAPVRGLTTWLTGQLRAGIVQGRLAPGTRLPATRTLAGDLGIARGVVTQAYQRLGDEGLLQGRPGVGTLVMALTAPPAPRPPPEPNRSHQRLPQLPATRPTQSKANTHTTEFDLSPGLPDLTAFPRAAWLRAERVVLEHLSAADLGYGDPAGNPQLRQELTDWLARTRGVHANPDDIIIVAGVAQSLALLAQTLRARGATAIAVEDPGSRGASDELTHWGLRPTPIAVDNNGIQVDALASSDLPAALLTPAHQFPTGVVLSPSRRRALLDWARTGGLIIEDDYDAEHRYDRAPVTALQPSATEHIAYTGSTSKTLAPGLRLGWLIPPRHMHPDLIAAKHASDLGSPVLAQLVLAHLLASGAYDRHLRIVRTRQRRRRDAILTALHQHLPHAHVEGVAAGLHLLITLPNLPADTDDTALAAAVRRAGVHVHPLSWHRHHPGPPGLILGYAAHPPDRLHNAVHRLAAALPTTPPN